MGSRAIFSDTKLRFIVHEFGHIMRFNQDMYYTPSGNPFSIPRTGGEQDIMRILVVVVLVIKFGHISIKNGKMTLIKNNAKNTYFQLLFNLQ